MEDFICHVRVSEDPMAIKWKEENVYLTIEFLDGPFKGAEIKAEISDPGHV